MLFNYKTGVYDEPKDDLDYSMYIPQHNAAEQQFEGADIP